jgi:hypothetical protein
LYPSPIGAGPPAEVQPAGGAKPVKKVIMTFLTGFLRFLCSNWNKWGYLLLCIMHNIKKKSMKILYKLRVTDYNGNRFYANCDPSHGGFTDAEQSFL